MIDCAVESVVVPQAEGKDLLLHFLKGELMIVPHSDILLGLLILLSGDVYRRVIIMGQAPSNLIS